MSNSYQHRKTQTESDSLDSSGLSRWQIVESNVFCDCPILSLSRRKSLQEKTGREGDFFVIECRDWVVAMARKKDGKYLLVNQFRHGSNSFSREFPAGCMEPGEGVEAAARRELLEETGYGAGDAVVLGQSHPNPAIQANTIYFVFIKDVEYLQVPCWDEYEELAIESADLKEIQAMALNGEIHHALFLNALYLLEKSL